MISIWNIVLTTVLTCLGTFLIARYNRNDDRKVRGEELTRNANYLIIRVVCLLDVFVTKSCEVVQDDGEVDYADGITQVRAEEPYLELPQDVDWKSIPLDFLYRIHTLRNDIDGAMQTIEFVASEIATSPDYDEVFKERHYQFGKLGLAAFDLAAELRSAYELPPKKYDGWNPREILLTGASITDAISA